MNRQRALLVAVLAMIATGVFTTVRDVVQFASIPAYQALSGPVDVLGKTLRFVESDAADATQVDVMHGDAVLARDVTRVVSAGATDYEARYAGRASLVVPKGGDGLYELVIVSGPDRLQRIALVAPDVVQTDGGALANAADRSPALIPGPAWLALAGCVWLLFSSRRPSAAPTLLLVLSLAIVAIVVAWPMQLAAGLGRTLPPAVLAMGVTLLVALGAGPRVQSRIAPLSRSARWLRGVVVGVLVVGLFTALHVNISGFIAPVFRPPDASLTPLEWVVRDVVQPGMAMFALGLVPGVLAGAVYGHRLGRGA